MGWLGPPRISRDAMSLPRQPLNEADKHRKPKRRAKHFVPKGVLDTSAKACYEVTVGVAVAS